MINSFVQNTAKQISEAVDWLKKNDEGCSTIKLDDRLAICVGWSDGFDPKDKTIIHSKTQPSWAIVAAIKVWTSDDLQTDIDWINAPYFEEDGSVWDDEVSISPKENYISIAEYLLEDFETLKQYDISEEGAMKFIDDTESEEN